MPVPVEGAADPASPSAATGADLGKGYDESWIPNHHINRPVAKRVKSSGKAKVKAAE